MKQTSILTLLKICYFTGISFYVAPMTLPHCYYMMALHLARQIFASYLM